MTTTQNKLRTLDRSVPCNSKQGSQHLFLTVAAFRFERYSKIGFAWASKFKGVTVCSFVQAVALLSVFLAMPLAAQNVPSGFASAPNFDDEFSADSAVNTNLWGWRYDGDLTNYCYDTDNTYTPGIISFLTDNSSASGTAQITGFRATSNVVTFYAANALLAGTTVTISALTSTQGATLNKNVVVLATGLSKTQFEAAITTSDTAGEVADTGYAEQKYARISSYYGIVNAPASNAYNGTTQDICAQLYSLSTALQQRYGYYEAAVRLGYQQGAAAAFWLQGNKQNVPIGNEQAASQEFDIFEHTSWTNSGTGYDHNVWWNDGSAFEGNGLNDLTTLSTLQDGNFHRFGMAWEPNQVTFYVDGNVVDTKSSMTAAQYPITDNTAEYIVVDTAVNTTDSDNGGGAFPYGSLFSSDNPYLDVAYIRVYPYAQSTIETTISPTADAYVSDAAPTTNYGSSTMLGAETGSTGSNVNSYLQFNLATVPGKVQQATLYLTPTNMENLSFAVTGYSITSDVVTVYTTSNNFTAGTLVDVGGLSTTGGLKIDKNQLTVLSTGLSSSQFEASYTAVNTSGTIADSGFATPSATYNITGYSVSNNVVTFYASNSLVKNTMIQTAGLSSKDGVLFNQQPLRVLSTGLSSSKFEVDYTAGTLSNTSGTNSDTGTATLAFPTEGLYSVSSSSWTQSGITWNNQPQTVSSTTTPVSTGMVFGLDVPMSFDATVPAEALTGNSPELSLEVAGICSICTSTSGNYLQFGSSNNGTTSYQPTLMLVTTPGLSYSTSSLSFGNQSQGIPSAAQTVTVTNNGLATVTFTSIALSSPFAETDTCSPSLASGASCVIDVTFTPTATGTFAATLTVTDSDAGPAQAIPLSGSGTSGPIPSLSTSTVSFGNVTVTSTSSASKVTFSNSASAGATLTGIAVSIAGANFSQFDQTNNCPTSLAPGGSCTINVTFTPASVASISATLDLTDNFDTSPQTVTLTGVGVAIVPSITWAPSATGGFTGVVLGNGVLDASASTTGTFSYTATPVSGTPSTVTSSSVLAAGTYTLTTNFTPSSNQYTTATATQTFTVAVQHLWVVNTSGSLAGLDDGGNSITTSAASGGGVGAAVDSSGDIWSINIGGNGLSEFNKSGTAMSTSYAGGGLSGASALAIDGSGQIWTANGSGSLSVFSNAGTALSPAAGLAPNSLSTPTGIAIDNAGSVWIGNSGNNTVTEVIGAAVPVATPTQSAVQNITLGTKP
jgi:hypothetical protein